MAKYNIFQQTFALSFFSNGLTDIIGSASYLEEILTNQINDYFHGPNNIQSLIGNWKLVWGPVVFQAALSECADNTMYVAMNDENVYVVAIAGTNILSLYDITLEDLWVNKTTAWHYSPVPSSNVEISKGTELGISKLLAMTSQGQTLAAFFKEISNKSEATIIFTGHSLGGALAPTLALALMSPDNNFGLNKNDWRAVHVYPVAGPTPGSKGFAEFFSQIFPIQNDGKELWESWNSLIWNDLDVIPYNWSTKTLPQIPNLYTPYIEPNLLVESWVECSLIASNRSQANYTQLQNLGSLSGSVNTNIPPNFFQQLIYQHISAYFILLGVTEIMPNNSSETEKKASERFANQLNQKFAAQFL